MKKTPHRLCTSMGCFINEQVCKPGSVCAAIYLDAPLPMRSSRLHGTTGPVVCPSTALLRIEFTAPFRLRTVGELLPRLSTLTCKAGGISLLHLSWGHPRRALPVILALWSPDFPHPGPVGNPAATVRPGRGNIVTHHRPIVKHLENSFPRGYTIPI